MIDPESAFGRSVRQQLEDQYVIWLTTVDSSLTPQPRPVWFIWQDDSFVIYSQAKAHKLKHIAKHPRVALHFNTDERGDRHVMIFTGEAIVDDTVSAAHETPAYLAKYQEGIRALGSTPEEFSGEYSVAIKIRPTEVRGWE
ncbi:MAG TPA: TIGR03667 family PPOX class F420-dependent oxidoreductase [Anaerolineales bacterium]|nr:TIGR03667 family PPOX class F420-dependent oxidoreductase [Anaerolineales bacterium]